jgi:hypothetical protein
MEAMVVPSSTGQRFLRGSITVTGNRSYRVEASLLSGKTTSTANLPLLLLSNHTYYFQVEPWPEGGREKAVTETVVLRFWPPVAGDGVEVWECGCSRSRTESHWEARVPVVRAFPEPARVLKLS